MQTKLKLKTGDTVVVISGNHKGASGAIKSINRETHRVIVEGVNMVKRHTKPSPQQPEGKIIEKEGSLHISNVKLKVGDVVTRVGRKLNESGTKLVRYAQKTAEEIK